MITAGAIIDAAQTLLNDEGTRWPRADCLKRLNEGQRQIVAVRPDAKTLRDYYPLVAGALQTLPDVGLRLLNVVRNQAGRAITLVSAEQLTAFDPNWYRATAKTTIKHFLYDPRSPKEYEVYPPAAVGANVQVLMSVLPTDCDDEDAPIDLDDLYDNALIDWICYRCFQKDLEAPESAVLADLYLKSFMLGLTGKAQSDQSTDPGKSEPNKLRPAMK